MRELTYPGLSLAMAHEARKRDVNIGDKLRQVFGLGPESNDSKEPPTVAGFRTVKESDYPQILEWLLDEETTRHLSPRPPLPEDWEDKEQIDKALYKLHEYYINLNPEQKSAEPENITALVATNEKDEALGVLTIRWRGDPWVPKGHKIASIERVIVNPKVQGKGVGTKLVDRALDVIFDEKDYREVRTWIMTDEIAGNWQQNYEFFNKFGFDRFPHPDSSYENYCKKRGIVDPEGRTKAWWLSLKRETWQERKNLAQPVQQTLILSDTKEPQAE